MKTLIILTEGLLGGAEKSTLESYDYFKKKLLNCDLKRIKLPKIKINGFLRDLLLVPFSMRNLKEFDDNLVMYLNNSTSLFLVPRDSISKKVIFCRILLSRQVNAFRMNLPFKFKIFFNPVTQFIVDAIERNSLQKADVIVVYRKSLKKFLIEKMNIDKGKIKVIPQGIMKVPAPKENYKQKDLIVLFVGGNGSYKKNFENFLKFSNMYKDKNIKFLALVRKVSKSLKKLSKRSNIIIETNVDKERVNKFYKNSDIFFIPSLEDTGPRVTLEAMSYGLPIIGTSEGLGEYCNGKGGFSIHETNLTDWKEKLDILINNPKLRKKFGIYNRERLKKIFTKKKQVESELKLIRGLKK